MYHSERTGSRAPLSQWRTHSRAYSAIPRASSPFPGREWNSVRYNSQSASACPPSALSSGWTNVRKADLIAAWSRLPLGPLAPRATPCSVHSRYNRRHSVWCWGSLMFHSGRPPLLAAPCKTKYDSCPVPIQIETGRQQAQSSPPRCLARPSRNPRRAEAGAERGAASPPHHSSHLR